MSTDFPLETNDLAKTYCTSFVGPQQIASGELADVAIQAKAVLDADPQAAILIFDDTTSKLIEVDFRGTAEEIQQRLLPPPGTEPSPVPGPGRPKLGVIAREVTLLPRHWDWLNNQPGGASVALRKLVEEARRANQAKDRIRQYQEAAYRFMSSMAGDRAGFEEATRALYAGNQERFNELVELWPEGIRDHAKKLASITFQEEVK